MGFMSDVTSELRRFGYGELRPSTKIVVGLVAAAGVGVTVVLLAWDFFSSDSSSTAVILIPVMALATGCAIAIVVFAEALVRAAIRSLKRRYAIRPRRT